MKKGFIGATLLTVSFISISLIGHKLKGAWHDLVALVILACVCLGAMLFVLGITENRKW